MSHLQQQNTYLEAPDSMATIRLQVTEICKLMIIHIYTITCALYTQMSVKYLQCCKFIAKQYKTTQKTVKH